MLNFENLESLENLNLVNNYILNFDFENLGDVENLKILNLKCNKIEKLEEVMKLNVFNGL